MNIKYERKGFTLVELLAVIVILAIIMIIAIPSVLGTVETARQKTFKEFMQKAYNAGVQKFLVKKEFEGITRPGGYDTAGWVFDIKEDLDLSNIGDFEGIFMVNFYGENYAANINKNYYEANHIDNSVKPFEMYYSVMIRSNNYFADYSSQEKDTFDNVVLYSISELEAYGPDALDEINYLTNKNLYFERTNEYYNSMSPQKKASYPDTLMIDGATNEKRFNVKK